MVSDVRPRAWVRHLLLVLLLELEVLGRCVSGVVAWRGTIHRRRHVLVDKWAMNRSIATNRLLLL